MKKTLLLVSVLSLTLASCAPVAQLVAPATQLAQPNERGSLTREGLTLLVNNPGPDALTGDPTVPGDGPALRVTGVNIAPDAAAGKWCVPDAAEIGVAWFCNLPEVPGGLPLRVAFRVADPTPALTALTQITDAALLAYRPSLGARPVLLWLK